MIKILDLIHKSIALFVAFTVLICIDLPLKLVGLIFLLSLAILISIFYPIFKRIGLPNFIDSIYDYVTSKQTIAYLTYQEWMK